MEIKSVGGMLGLFTNAYYKQGEVVLKIEGEILSAPTMTTIQIAPHSHVDVGSPAKYINHSCDANCHIKNQKLIASRDIESHTIFRADDFDDFVVVRKYNGKSYKFDRIDYMNIEYRAKNI